MSRRIPQPPYNTDSPADAIATALVIFACVAEDVRRIADRLDSWTHEPGPPGQWTDPNSAEAKGRGPELRVRRW